MEDLISVVIPTFGRTDTLQHAVSSVMTQTYQHFEILIVDDNTDPEISLEVEKIVSLFQDNRIRRIKNERNLGGALSRNEGIYASRGEYIAFLDDDDRFYPEKLQKQLALIKKSPDIAIVYNWVRLVREGGKVYKVFRKKHRGNCVFDAMKDCIASTSLWLCRKSALQSVGCFSNTPCKQDSYLLLKLMLHGYQIDYVPEVLSEYSLFVADRISTKGHPVRIAGEEYLRQLCRDHYDLITKAQQQEVEFYAATRLIEHYLAIKDTEKIRECLFCLLRRPFHKQSLRAFVHCLRLFKEKR